ncbi:MAG: NAD(P)-binding protein [Proteobacteria bacterium]|nr:NAD(P)-binding protein [Pseudomonadota bacterium]
MSKKRISIVGAGPAGLYAAEKLAQQGYETTLFDHKVPWKSHVEG